MFCVHWYQFRFEIPTASMFNLISKKKKFCRGYHGLPCSNYIFFLLTKMKTSSLQHFEAHENVVKIYEGQLSAHNQTKLLTGSIYPPENSKSTEFPTVQFFSDNFL